MTAVTSSKEPMKYLWQSYFPRNINWWFEDFIDFEETKLLLITDYCSVE